MPDAVVQLPLAGKEAHLLLSYPPACQLWAVQLFDMLRSWGLEVLAREYPAAADVAALPGLLARSRAAILAWPAAVRAREWCRREYEALSAHKAQDATFRWGIAVAPADPAPPAGNYDFSLDARDFWPGPRWAEVQQLLERAFPGELPGGLNARAQQLDQGCEGALRAIDDAQRAKDVSRLVQLAATQDDAWGCSPLLASAAAAGLRRLKATDRAREVLEQAVQAHPRWVRPRHELLDLEIGGLIGRKRYAAALAASRKSPQEFPESVRVRQLRGLALRRKGDLEQAQAVLEALEQAGLDDPETLGMLASAWMDRYLRSKIRSQLQRSRDLYRRAFERLLPEGAKRDSYVGINVAAKSALLGEMDVAQDYAGQVEAILTAEAADGPLDYWKAATWAEVRLIQRNYQEAARCYQAAVQLAPDLAGDHESTWLQAQRLLAVLQAPPDAVQQVAAAFPGAGPAMELNREVRLAVVMYGGVSLAIYINGVAQELFNLVRATAPVAGAGQGALSAQLLTSTQKVYRKLSQILDTDPNQHPLPPHELAPIRARFILDILSGTSAGGINALFLAKALAYDQSMDDLKTLWYRQADFAQLLNDRTGFPGMTGKAPPPRSLLDSKHMYRKLLEALEGMDGQKRPPVPVAAADQLDLYVTATDVEGLVLPVPLADRVVREKRHRNVFHFRHADPAVSSDPRADFGRENNPFLAFVARCTSAFPFAFEPMKLSDIDAVVPAVFPYNQRSAAQLRQATSANESWRDFYEDYLDLGSAGAADATTLHEAAQRFAGRAFSDGGCLDNKPFSYVLEGLSGQRADVPMARKLLYIEPAPEQLPANGAAPREFDVVQNVLAAIFTLPTYETIRQDLEQVRKRNLLIEQVEQITDHLEDDIQLFQQNSRSAAVTAVGDGQWGNNDLNAMVRVKGPGYAGYHRLKVAAVADDLAMLAATAGGFPRTSGAFQGTRYLLRAWAREHYVESNAPGAAPRTTQNRFLVDFDLGYRLRRLDFLRTKLDELARLSPRAQKLLAAANLGHAWPTDDPQRREFRSAVRDLKPALNVVFQELLGLRQRLSRRFSAAKEERDTPVARMRASMARLADLASDLETIAGEATEARRVEAAGNYLARCRTDIDRVADELVQVLRKVFQTASERCAAALDPAQAPASLGPFERAVRSCLWHYYRYFEDYDQAAFPVLQQTGLGEVARVDVHRISPADLDDPRELSRLAGTAFGNFGGFLAEDWRRNDLLWGRLHAAERLLRILLPDDPRREPLLQEARDLIVAEEVKARGDTAMTELLLDVLRNAQGGPPSPAQEAEIRQRLDQSPLREARMTQEQLRDYVLNLAPVPRTLDPQLTVRLLARSTQIVGKILQDLAGRYSIDSRPAAWLTRLGLWFWGLVEVAVPGSLANLVYRHWLHLLYVFELLLIAGGIVFVEPTVQRLGLLCLGITAGVNMLVWVLEDYLNGRRKPGLLSQVPAIGRLLALVAVLWLAALGALTVWFFSLQSLANGAGHLPGRLRLATVVGVPFLFTTLAAVGALQAWGWKTWQWGKKVLSGLGTLLFVGLTSGIVLGLLSVRTVPAGEPWYFYLRHPLQWLADWWLQPPF